MQTIQMKWKMLFRIGLSLVIGAAVLLFYLNNRLTKDERSKLSNLVKNNNQAFQEALIKAHDIEEPQKQGLHDESVIEEGPLHGPVAHIVKEGNGKGKEEKVKEQEVKVSVKEKEQVKEKTVVKEAGGKMHGKAGIQPVHHRFGKMVGSHVHKIHLSVVICGDRAPESLVLFKSAVVLTSSPLVLHIFAETELHTFLTQQLNFWPSEVLERVEYMIYNITFPEGENAEEWKKLFKPCASQRLFLPLLLADVDSLIYVDTDILFVSPLENLWGFFSRFNATQLVALAPEHEDPNVGWYNRFARHPFVPPLGVNSGVMLMNLTRLRQSTWLPSMLTFYKEYRLKITWGDQDLINIYFHYHPEELYIYTCEWNFRPDHCMYMSVCKPAEKLGAFVLHGSRRSMHNGKHPAFKAAYDAFRDYHLSEDVEFVLLEKVRRNLDTTKTTPCGKVAHIFLKQIEQYVSDIHAKQKKRNILSAGT